MKEKLETIHKVQNLVVARYRDGKMIRGVTHDFGPQKKAFHVNTMGEEGGELEEEFLKFSFQS